MLGLRLRAISRTRRRAVKGGSSRLIRLAMVEDVRYALECDFIENLELHSPKIMRNCLSLAGCTSELCCCEISLPRTRQTVLIASQAMSYIYTPTPQSLVHPGPLGSCLGLEICARVAVIGHVLLEINSIRSVTFPHMTMTNMGSPLQKHRAC